MKVRFKETGQTGTIPDDKFDPNLFDPIDAPQTNFLGSIASAAGQGAKGVYDFLKPPTYASMVEPVAEATGRTAMVLPELFNAFQGKAAQTPQEQQRRNEYVEKMTPLMKTITEKYSNPWNYGAAATELALGKLAGGAEKVLGKAAGTGLVPWLIKKGGSGAATGFAYGASRPEQGGDIGARVQKGVEAAPTGAFANVLLSGLFEAPNKIAKTLKGEAKYLTGKQFPTIDAKNLNEAKYQEEVSEAILKNTKGFKPETIAKEAQEKVSALTDDVATILKRSDKRIDMNNFNDEMNSIVAQNTQGYSKENKSLTSEFTRLLNKATKYFDRTPIDKVGAGEGKGSLYSTSIENFYKGKQELGKDMAENGVFKRIQNGTGTTEDKMAKMMYDRMKNMLDEQVLDIDQIFERVRTNAATKADIDFISKLKSKDVIGQLIDSGDPIVSSMTELQSKLIEGGLAGLKESKGISGKPSMIDLRQIPGMRLLLPYIQAGETAALRKAYKIGSLGETITGSNQVKDLLKQLVTPAVIRQQVDSQQEPTPQSIDFNTAGQPNPAFADDGYNTIRVKIKGTNTTGYIPESEFNPKLFERLP